MTSSKVEDSRFFDLKTFASRAESRVSEKRVHFPFVTMHDIPAEDVLEEGLVWIARMQTANAGPTTWTEQTMQVIEQTDREAIGE